MAASRIVRNNLARPMNTTLLGLTAICSPLVICKTLNLYDIRLLLYDGCIQVVVECLQLLMYGEQCRCCYGNLFRVSLGYYGLRLIINCMHSLFPVMDQFIDRDFG